MVGGGEDPLYVARRVVRMAAEDIGLADPRALSVALAAEDAHHFLVGPGGQLASPEGRVLARASGSATARGGVGAGGGCAARESLPEPVPLHSRNAPTPLMKGLG